MGDMTKHVWRGYDILDRIFVILLVSLMSISHLFTPSSYILSRCDQRALSRQTSEQSSAWRFRLVQTFRQHDSLSSIRRTSTRSQLLILNTFHSVDQLRVSLWYRYQRQFATQCHHHCQSWLPAKRLLPPPTLLMSTSSSSVSLLLPTLKQQRC